MVIWTKVPSWKWREVDKLETYLADKIDALYFVGKIREL